MSGKTRRDLGDDLDLRVRVAAGEQDRGEQQAADPSRLGSEDRGVGPASWWDWTGIPEKRWWKTQNEEVRPAKNLWDLLQLLIVPAILIGITLWWNSAQSSRDKAAAADERQAATLNAYLDEMGRLMLHEHLLSSKVNTPVKSVADNVTSAALRRLNGEQKRQVVRFLYVARLVNRASTDVVSDPNPLVSLQEADLKDADLAYADLHVADLAGADLRRADLRHAKLVAVNLASVKLGHADLRDADLTGALLTSADLSYADLRGAKLNQANLAGAMLTHADLRDADLNGAKGVKLDGPRR
jgi:uncharacterized protein YjbI with pentapeptide repeats